jgi:N-acyl-D-aspartate/D-glutamate deacylase
MGKRASLADRPGGAAKDPVLPQEIAAMAALVRDAVASGALGFSTSRLLVHRDPQVPHHCTSSLSQSLRY